MATKPEAQFKSGVHNHIPTGVHYEGMANPYRSGTPDVWYDGDASDLWVEYKYLPKLPPTIKPLDLLSAHQCRWLDRAHRNGRSVAVIIGCPDGGVILTDGAWHTDIPREVFIQCSISRKALAAWICQKVSTSLRPSISAPRKQSRAA